MAASFIQVALDATGKKMQSFLNTLGADAVHAQAVSLVDAAGLGIGPLANAELAGSITAIDAVVLAPSGTGLLRSGASTAGSVVALAVPAGYGAWTLQISTYVSGILYTEASLDSTNGTDGNWVALKGLMAGTTVGIEASTFGMASTGVWRGDVAGFSWFRVRQVGGASGAAVRLEITPSSGIRVDSPSPANLAVSVTAAAAAAATLTIPAPAAGLSIYLSTLEISLYCTVARVGSATPTIVTTTNLSGTPSFNFPSAQAVGTIDREDVGFGLPLKAAAAATAVTIVGPATANAIWKINAFYYVAP